MSKKFVINIPPELGGDDPLEKLKWCATLNTLLMRDYNNIAEQKPKGFADWVDQFYNPRQEAVMLMQGVLDSNVLDPSGAIYLEASKSEDPKYSLAHIEEVN